MSKYFKLKDISQFTVTKVFGYKWKMWIEAERRMMEEERWFQGASKKYNLGVLVNGEQGYLEVSSNQLGSMLEAFQQDGQSNIINQSFNVKTNGKQGMEIRYYINPEYKGAGDAPTDNVPTPSGYVESQYSGAVVSQTPVPEQGSATVSTPVNPNDKPISVDEIPF